MRVAKPNKAVVENRKILPYHKRVDKRSSDIQESIGFANSVILQIAKKSLNPRKNLLI